MRVFIVTLAALPVLTLAQPVMAQGLNADGLRPKPSVESVETSPLKRLAPEARAWIAQARERQKSEPTDLVELAVDIDRSIGEAIRKVARRERIGNGDLILVVMYEIVGGARDDVGGDLARLHKSGAPPADRSVASRTPDRAPTPC